MRTKFKGDIIAYEPSPKHVRSCVFLSPERIGPLRAGVCNLLREGIMVALAIDITAEKYKGVKEIRVVK